MRVHLAMSFGAAMLVACGAAPSQPTTGNGEAGPADRPFTVTPVAQFETPWAMAFLPGSGVPMTNMALVTEKSGTLWLVDTRSGQKQQVSGVPTAKVAGQGGLGDVVPHPDFAGNQRVYLSYVEPGDGDTSGAVVGYGRLLFTSPAVPGGPVGASLEGFKVIWRQSPKVTGNGHFSHRIVFSPDGLMFVSSGDRQKLDPAQDTSGDLGKVLRLTDEGAPAPGNPWATQAGRAAQWTLGHRNILGLAFAPDGRLWETEMGPEGGDELNLIMPGKNYGWPRVSYGSHYGGEDIPDAHASAGFEEPKVWWTPSISPGGLLIYNGSLFSDWRGDAFIPALSGQALIRVDINGDTARKADQWAMGARIRAVDEGPRGELYLLEDGRNGTGGRLLRLEPAR